MGEGEHSLFGAPSLVLKRHAVNLEKVHSLKSAHKRAQPVMLPILFVTVSLTQNRMPDTQVETKDIKEIRKADIMALGHCRGKQGSLSFNLWLTIGPETESGLRNRTKVSGFCPPLCVQMVREKYRTSSPYILSI